MTTYKHTNGRSYKIRVGSRGGKYIIVAGKKIYLKNERKEHRGGMSDDSCSDCSWLDDEDDKEAFQIFCKGQANTHRKPALDIIKTFLETTKNDYIVIGGKAAAEHINSIRGTDDSLKNIAQSTNDYDVAISENNKNFINDLTTALKSCYEQLDYQTSNIKKPTIHLFGVKRDGIMDSFIDVHVYPEDVYTRLKKEPLIIKGIRYANIKNVCEELSTSIMNHDSWDQPFKTVKRCARYNLLKCNQMVIDENAEIQNKCRRLQGSHR